MTAPAAATRMRFRGQSAQKGFDSMSRGRASQESVANPRPRMCSRNHFEVCFLGTWNPSRRDMVQTVTAQAEGLLPIRTIA